MTGTSSISYQITKAVVTPPLKAAVEMTYSSQMAKPRGSHSTHEGQDCSRSSLPEQHVPSNALILRLPSTPLHSLGITQKSGIKR